MTSTSFTNNLVSIMASTGHISRKDLTPASKMIKHRTTSPTLALILPPPSRTQDDVAYGHFIKHLLEPFVGRVRGVDHAPPGIICGHLMPEGSGGDGGKRGRRRFSCVRRLLRRFAWRCWFMARRAVDVVVRRNHLVVPEDSVLNQRIEVEESIEEEPQE